MEEISTPRSLILVIFDIHLHIPIAFYSSECFLIAVFLIGVIGLLVDLHPQKIIKKLIRNSSSEDRQNCLKWANKRYYAFSCDPKKRSNSFRLKFYCSRSQQEVESPLSATQIAITNQGVEFDDTRRGWRNIRISDMEENKFENSCFTFKKLTDRVHGAYFNFKGISYPAGCSLSIGNVTQEDTEVFLEFSKNQRFSNFLKSLENQKIRRIVNLKESDLKVLYATRHQDDFVIFARNLKNLKIEKFIYDTKRYGFERVETTLNFDESKVLEDGNRCLLFMTYSETRGRLETLTVCRTEDGRFEKKILEGGKFRVIEEKDIVERRDEEIEDEDDYEFVRMPDEGDVYEC